MGPTKKPGAAWHKITFPLPYTGARLGDGAAAGAYRVCVLIDSQLSGPLCSASWRPVAAYHSFSVSGILQLAAGQQLGLG